MGGLNLVSSNEKAAQAMRGWRRMRMPSNAGVPRLQQWATGAR